MSAVIHSAEVLAIGSELLSPHRVDTNSLWLTGRLNELGIAVRLKGVVGDEPDDLAAAIRQARSRADLVITTGGLGPTADDITRDVVAGVVDRRLAPDATVLEAIGRRLERRGLPLSDRHRRQAMIPAGAVVLPNAVGTAPGFWIEEGHRVLVALPGPPRELQAIFDEHVAPRLALRGPGRRLRRRVLKLTGISEARADEIAQPVYSAFRSGALSIATTLLASPGQIELHLSAAGEDVAALDVALGMAVERLAEVLGQHVFSTDGRSLEEMVGSLLLARSLRVAVAESCTAGLVLARLTDVPGSSQWVVGGIVAYDDQVKIRELDVPVSLLADHGAVSEPVAAAMAAGVRRRLGADVSVAVTGIAGPGGGSERKPVGTVVLAVDGVGARAKTLSFGGDRSMVRQQSVAAALDLLRRTILESSRATAYPVA